MVEFWRQFRKTKYYVSPLGDIKNINTGIILKKETHYKGHLKVGLYISVKNSKKKVSKKFFVHRLVAECWLHKRKNRNIVNHIDANKQNNYISNLEYCTLSENTKHAYEKGLINLEYARSCRKNGQNKL